MLPSEVLLYVLELAGKWDMVSRGNKHYWVTSWGVCQLWRSTCTSSAEDLASFLKKVCGNRAIGAAVALDRIDAICVLLARMDGPSMGPTATEHAIAKGITFDRPLALSKISTRINTMSRSSFIDACAAPESCFAALKTCMGQNIANNAVCKRGIKAAFSLDRDATVMALLPRFEPDNFRSLESMWESMTVDICCRLTQGASDYDSVEVAWKFIDHCADDEFIEELQRKALETRNWMLLEVIDENYDGHCIRLKRINDQTAIAVDDDVLETDDDYGADPGGSESFENSDATRSEDNGESFASSCCGSENIDSERVADAEDDRICEEDDEWEDDDYKDEEYIDNEYDKDEWEDVCNDDWEDENAIEHDYEDIGDDTEREKNVVHYEDELLRQRDIKMYEDELLRRREIKMYEDEVLRQST